MKISDLDLEGRERPAEARYPSESLVMREDSWDVNAKLVDDDISFAAFEDFGRGVP